MIKNRILTAAAMPLLAVLCLFSCGKEKEPEAKEPAKAVSWTPDAESLIISVGNSATVSGEVLFDDGTRIRQDALCTSKDEKIVFADGGYTIYGLAQGMTYVTATVTCRSAEDGKAPSAVFSKNIKVTVKGDGENVILALELTPAEVTLDYDEEVTFKIHSCYSDGSRREVWPEMCTWTVIDDGDQHIVYDKRGTVCGKQGPGETILIAEYTEEGKTVMGSAKIYVNE